MKMDFDESLLHNIAGPLILFLICLLVIVLGNYWVYSQLNEAPEQYLWVSRKFGIYATRNAFYLSIPPLTAMIAAGASMYERTKIYRAYHQIKRKQNKNKHSKD